ncbi:MAG TPA: hypothetical protein VGE93_24145 [Bryobacteraceae bacterium]|nr:hypothetical protein [Acidobacteriaceae bacterium]
MSWELAQKQLCTRYQATFTPSHETVNSGFARSTQGLLPLNGLRHVPVNGTTGWYLWCGETFSDAPDFFQPVHTLHIYEQYPEVAELLGLPPGYRFLKAREYLDVWFDPNLLIETL